MVGPVAYEAGCQTSRSIPSCLLPYVGEGAIAAMSSLRSESQSHSTFQDHPQAAAKTSRRLARIGLGTTALLQFREPWPELAVFPRHYHRILSWNLAARSPWSICSFSSGLTAPSDFAETSKRRRSGTAECATPERSSPSAACCQCPVFPRACCGYTCHVDRVRPA